MEKIVIKDFIPDEKEFKKYFDKLLPCLDGRLQPEDTMSLVRLCELYATRDRVKKLVDESSIRCNTGRGDSDRSSYVKDPVFTIYSQLNSDCLAIEKELGLTPRSRKLAGVEKTKKQKDNPFAALEGKKRGNIVNFK